MKSTSKFQSISSFTRQHTTLATAMVVAIALFLFGGCATNTARTADRDAPLTTANERDQFRELLLKALDREALYTLVGGLKPLSTGFWHGKVDLAAPDIAEIARVRRALAPLRSATYYADVQVFATAHDGTRHIEAYIVHRTSLAAMIEREAAFWSPLGITPCTHPAEVVAVVDRLPKTDRWRAYGLLFGYPNYAIDFFVEANEHAKATGGEVGPGKDREFYHIPTASGKEGQFTWAVPLGHIERDEDRAIRQRAEAILTAYRSAPARIAVASDPLRHVEALSGTSQQQSSAVRYHQDAAATSPLPRSSSAHASPR
jgi:hypothetical protein